MNKNTIFITGAASGIGLATAKHFHKKGYWVGMADINLVQLTQATEIWDRTRVRLFQLDVSDFSQVQHAMAKFCADHNDCLAVLLNNAGILEIGPFEEIPIEHHQRTIIILRICKSKERYSDLLEFSGRFSLCWFGDL